VISHKYICLHGHFYQPPRENPWTGKIDRQPSAAPFHDWNQRITDECYRANAQSRILDSQGHVERVVNNYSLMSFNFGPTLLSWMMVEAPDVYQSIIQADKFSCSRFSGHGSAMAQSYNHIIMPLANSRDKRTQVIWGVKDFQRHFGRMPEGMWLSETAVDYETLELMAEHKIKFMVLAPWQARDVKGRWSWRWRSAGGGRVDTGCAYECRLPSGNKINIFFYDGAIASDVAFGGLLKNGDVFAKRLKDAFRAGARGGQLVHIATDGETYGHHHKFGNMALSYCFYRLEHDADVIVTNYGEFLEKNPPRSLVRINENTSWSCSHGVERWRSNCGCRLDTSIPPRQEWRYPLREALDWLRDQMTVIFEETTKDYFTDPWLLRNEYINVVWNHTRTEALNLFNRHSRKRILQDQLDLLIAAYDMQYYAMLMYTSCGWFFDDVSRIETRQILQYACRAIELARKLSVKNLESDFLRRLEKAVSHEPGMRNGKHIYYHFIKPNSGTYEV
jgi:alpha-amylase/alpha-mannosidase (GH57 family)